MESTEGHVEFSGSTLRRRRHSPSKGTMMTTTTMADVSDTRAAASPTVTIDSAGSLGSEWTKLTTVRSTVWTLLATAVVGIGLGAIVTSAQASRWATRSLAARAAFDPTRSSLAGLLFAQLAIGVLGILVMSAEYSTGTIRATFSAVPRRPLVLVAKVAVFGIVDLDRRRDRLIRGLLHRSANPERQGTDGRALRSGSPPGRRRAAASISSPSDSWPWDWPRSSG